MLWFIHTITQRFWETVFSANASKNGSNKDSKNKNCWHCQFFFSTVWSEWDSSWLVTAHYSKTKYTTISFYGEVKSPKKRKIGQNFGNITTRLHHFSYSTSLCGLRLKSVIHLYKWHVCGVWKQKYKLINVCASWSHSIMSLSQRTQLHKTTGWVFRVLPKTE